MFKKKHSLIIVGAFIYIYNQKGNSSILYTKIFKNAKKNYKKRLTALTYRYILIS